MATFKVGQRVRKIKHNIGGSPSVPIGATGTIVAHDGRPNANGVMCDYDIIYDSEPSRRRTAQGWMLEPIQPERNKVIAWAECPWQPEHLRETTT